MAYSLPLTQTRALKNATRRQWLIAALGRIVIWKIYKKCFQLFVYRYEFNTLLNNR